MKSSIQDKVLLSKVLAVTATAHKVHPFSGAQQQIILKLNTNIPTKMIGKDRWNLEPERVEAKISGEFDFSLREVGRVKRAPATRTRASRKSSV